ncbi:MAG: carnitine dehydratase [Alphaproteobacteria bacterium]|nr:carnitine dehydratase [Alphaproteobacteria bacterium]|tara:strand:- start:3085 stop:4227 length:1143 start_codon:yes stop_codon:yes gene_type:complete
MLPLHDVRVIEFCQIAAGPFCGMLLADFGADVIKVENPVGGDSMRAWPPISDGYSENFASVNRNKRSITLDLKSPDELKAARDLVRSADVMIENFRAGVLDRLGLGHETLRKDHDSLIYCSISAYGQTGPRAQEGGFDLTVQAMSGIMSVTGEPGGAPVKCGVPLSDFSAGLYAAYAITAALMDVRRGEPGRHIDVSMLGASLGIAALQTSEYFGTGNDPAKLGSAHPRNAPYQAFQAEDGYFAMAAGNDRLWRSVCTVVGHMEYFDDSRFTTTTSRAANQVALKDLLEEEFGRKPVDYWLAAFRDAGVPCTPINSYSQILSDPHVKQMGWVQDLKLPSGHETKTFISPVIFGDQQLGVRRPPPALGEHNDEILSEITGQ